MRVFVFLVSGILEDGSVPFFRYEFVKVFFSRIVFSIGVFVFFGFRHFGKLFCCFFHMDLFRFLKQSCFFEKSFCVFLLQAFRKTVLCPFLI